MESTEVNNRETTQAVNKETLRSWIEQGFNNNAIAVYGTSTQTLEAIIKTGKLPQSSIDLDYKKFLVKEGRYLYYASPLMERVKIVKPKLARSIKDTSELQTIDTAKKYALSQSIRSPFSEIPEAEDNDVLALAREMIPKQFNRFLENVGKNIDPEEIDVNQNKKTIASIKSRLSPSQLQRTLLTCLEKRGVLFFLNKEIFRKNMVLPGYESEYEIMITAGEPLTASVISGIEVLSDADMRAIKKYL